MTKLAVVFVLGLAVIGCAPKEVPVTGEVFVVTRGGNSVKLGLVPVEVLTEAEVKTFLDKQLAAHEARVTAAEPAVKEAHEKAQQAGAALDEARKAYFASSAKLKALEPVKNPRVWLNYFNGPHKQAIQVEAAADAAYKKAEAKELIVKREAMKLSTGPELAKATPPAKINAKTNGDGKFSFMLLPGKYGVWAKGSRFVGGDAGDERYDWFVWVNVEKDKPVNIMLSNDNQIDSVCMTGCVVSLGTFRFPKDGSPMN